PAAPPATTTWPAASATSQTWCRCKRPNRAQYARRSSIGFAVGRLLRASPGGRAPRNPRELGLPSVVWLLSVCLRRATGTPRTRYLAVDNVPAPRGCVPGRAAYRACGVAGGLGKWLGPGSGVVG